MPQGEYRKLSCSLSVMASKHPPPRFLCPGISYMTLIIVVTFAYGRLPWLTCLMGLVFFQVYAFNYLHVG